ncbi:NAD(P)H:quinone oxidoreductase, type IV [Betaproteobacteria bacterium GR16-43]|nr:NAD(P)H:quinone oxidoreductase, type IV [Betaproteobacteria bacterium GR16-43]
MADILVLYYSASGSVKNLAQSIARGIDSVDGMRARVRTVPRVVPVTEGAAPVPPAPAVPADGAPYVEKRDLVECVGLALGSPTRFGNMAAPMKHFIDTLGAEWAAGTLAGKPAAVFSSTASMHGGQETTLVSMMFPLLHHGMVVVGIPYTQPELNTTRSGGTPYGATHVSGGGNDRPVTDEESKLAFALGQRLATVAKKLAA